VIDEQMKIVGVQCHRVVTSVIEVANEFDWCKCLEVLNLISKESKTHVGQLAGQ
jgi:hypothetical protein